MILSESDETRGWTCAAVLAKLLCSQWRKGWQLSARAPIPCSPMRTIQDELLNQTFQLAYFIHQDRETAKRITAAALESLETVTLTQDKRLYYLGRRTKVSFTELHLLQQLVHEKSVPFEQEREGNPARPLSEERLLVYFIKHLVWITVRRKSLYVVLGLGRLLYRYTTAETMELYNVIIQDPDRVPIADYFRNRKRVLMDELLERFGKLLTTTRGTHGALRFATHDQPTRFAELVNDCLTVFTPWQTDCHVPEHFSPTDTVLTAFSFNGTDPDEEHPVEIKRYHALLHPECFARLLRALGYAAPEQRLEIPRFCLASRGKSDDTSPDDPAGGAELNAYERDDLRSYLHDRERRRKTTNSQLLRFVANGAEVAQLDLQQTDRVRFQLPKYAESLEIRCRDAQDDLLLATHRLAYDDYDQLRTQNAIIVLQNGQKLAFEITPAHATADATITVAYGGTSLVRTLRLWLRWHNAPTALLRPLWQPALGFVLLTALTAGLAYVVISKIIYPVISEIVQTASPTPAPQVSPTAAPTSSSTPQPTAAAPPTPRPTAPPPLPGGEVIAVNIPTGQRTDSRRERKAAISLLEARQVCLKISGNERLRRLVREQLRTQLPNTVPFNLTDNCDADIALKLDVAPLSATGTTKRMVMTARIVDTSGEVVWPLTPSIRARKYSGSIGKTIAVFYRELTGDIRQLNQK